MNEDAASKALRNWIAVNRDISEMEAYEKGARKAQDGFEMRWLGYISSTPPVFIVNAASELIAAGCITTVLNSISFGLHALADGAIDPRLHSSEVTPVMLDILHREADVQAALLSMKSLPPIEGVDYGRAKVLALTISEKRYSGQDVESEALELRIIARTVSAEREARAGASDGINDTSAPPLPFNGEKISLSLGPGALRDVIADIGAGKKVTRKGFKEKYGETLAHMKNRVHGSKLDYRIEILKLLNEIE